MTVKFFLVGCLASVALACALQGDAGSPWVLVSAWPAPAPVGVAQARPTPQPRAP